jgi:hypothetical protein
MRAFPDLNSLTQATHASNFKNSVQLSTSSINMFPALHTTSQIIFCNSINYAAFVMQANFSCYAQNDILDITSHELHTSVSYTLNTK